jgi:hypothetical protein
LTGGDPHDDQESGSLEDWEERGERNDTNRNQEWDPIGKKKPAQQPNAGDRVAVIEEAVAQGSQCDEPQGEARGADEKHHIDPPDNLLASLLVRQAGDGTPLHFLLELETVAEHAQSEEDVGQTESQDEQEIDDLEVAIEVFEVLWGDYGGGKEGSGGVRVKKNSASSQRNPIAMMVEIKLREITRAPARWVYLWCRPMVWPQMCNTSGNVRKRRERGGTVA